MGIKNQSCNPSMDVENRDDDFMNELIDTADKLVSRFHGAANLKTIQGSPECILVSSCLQTEFHQKGPDVYDLPHLHKLMSELRLKEHNSHEKQLQRFFNFIKRPDVCALLHLHKLMSELRLKEHNSHEKQLQRLVEETCVVLHDKPFNQHVQQLIHLLQRPHMNALFSVNDTVASRVYEPILQDIPYEVDEDEGLAVKIVRLVKQNEPLGATIKRLDPPKSAAHSNGAGPSRPLPAYGSPHHASRDGSMVIIARVMKGGVADRSGCVQVGDRVIEVNGQSVDGLQPADIVKLLSSDSSCVTLKLVAAPFYSTISPHDDSGQSHIPNPMSSILTCNDPKLRRVRALFDYDPANDGITPCPEAGLPFRKGEILTLVSTEDPHWWQARYESDINGSVGLIPSKELQERKLLSCLAPSSMSPSIFRSGGSTGRDGKASFPGTPLMLNKHSGSRTSCNAAISSQPQPAEFTLAGAAKGGRARSVGQFAMSPVEAVAAQNGHSHANGTHSGHHHHSGGGVLSPDSLHRPRLHGASSTSRHNIIMYDTKASQDFDAAELRTYEDVARLYPPTSSSTVVPTPHTNGNSHGDTNQNAGTINGATTNGAATTNGVGHAIGYFVRPIVLIGPPGVGRNELKRRLLLSHPDRYSSPVPYTSRKPKPSECEGVEYHFVARTQMEKWVANGMMLEHGAYKNNIYGTTVESVREILSSGRYCILNPHPQALRAVRTAEFKPFIIYIAPPPFPVLKETRARAHARSTFPTAPPASLAGAYSRGFSDDELELMIGSGDRLEAVYGHWFDVTIVNEELELAYQQLVDTVKSMGTQPQWVPTAWVR